MRRWNAYREIRLLYYKKNEIALIFVMYMKLVSLAYLHISTFRFSVQQFNASLSKRISSLI